MRLFEILNEGEIIPIRKNTPARYMFSGDTYFVDKIILPLLQKQNIPVVDVTDYMGQDEPEDIKEVVVGITDLDIISKLDQVFSGKASMLGNEDAYGGFVRK